MDRNDKGQFVKGSQPEKRKGNIISCKICGKEKYVKRKYLIKGFGKYCSSKCYGKDKKGMSSNNPNKGNGDYIECSLKGCDIKKYFPLNLVKLSTKKYCSKEHKVASFIGRIPRNKGKHFPERQGKNSYQWKGGKPNCKKCGKILSTYKSILCSRCQNTSLEMKQKLLAERLKQQINKSYTRIEKILYEYLESKMIIFEKQKVIEFYTVDAYVPKLNLVIEADGEYWHSLPETIWRDKAKNTYLKKYGYQLIRLTENELVKGSFKEKIKML